MLYSAALIQTFAISAQDEKYLRPQTGDTTLLEMQKQIEYRQLVSGQLIPDVPEKPALPEFQFKSDFDNRYSISLNHYNFGIRSFNFLSLSSFDYSFTPFASNGFILSEGAYNLGNRFVFGGYSYATNPAKMPPMAPMGTNQFNVYGSTMFMQYKVGKNFKIETRFNVSQGHYPFP